MRCIPAAQVAAQVAARAAVLAAAFVALGLLAAGRAHAEAPDGRLSGSRYLNADLQALERDPDASPASLWVERGRQLWTEKAPGGACASCHGAIDKMRGVAAHFPTLDAATGQPRNLTDQIRVCRTQRQRLADEAAESEAVLSLAAALARVSAGTPIAPRVPAGREADWERLRAAGQQIYFTRMGRINLACTQCHDAQAGKRLRNDAISPAYTTGFPIYRLEWQAMGSIERRLRACYFGVQAKVPAPGDLRLRELEVFLAERARGMPLDGPALRH